MVSDLTKKRAGFIARHPVLVYYLLALAFSWSILLLLGAVKQGWIDLQVPFAIHYLAAFGPMVAALAVTAATGGWQGLRELWGRMVQWRVGWRWALFCTCSPAAAFVLTIPVYWLIKGEKPDLRLLGQANYLPYLGWAVLPLWLITFGFGEEIGWRGFALPRMQKTMSVSKATFLLGLMWALWHVPSFFYHETYVGMRWFIFPGFIFGVMCGAVIFTWLYNGSGGSVLMVALWHALFDLLTASKAGQDIIPILTSAGVIALALFLANVERPWGFRYQQKQVL